MTTAAYVQLALGQLPEGRFVPPAPPHRLAEDELLRRMLTARPEEQRALQEFFRTWGLREERLRRLRQGPPWERAYSALVLGRMQVREALPAILPLFASRNIEMRLAALRAVELLGVPEALELLVKVLPEVKDTAWRMVWAALISCARSQPERLLVHVNHPEPKVRAVVVAALGEVATPSLLGELLAHTDEPDPEVRAKLARALGRSGSPQALPVLGQWTKDPTWYVRLQAVGALGALGDRAAHDFLMAATRDSNLLVREKAAASLYLLWGDAIYLIDLLRQDAPDRSSLEALVSVLEWQGVTWEAINHVNSPQPSVREQSRELVARLAAAGAYGSVLYAIEMHTDTEVRRALVEVLAPALPAAGVRDLSQLLGSPYLDANTRREIEKRVGSSADTGHDLG